MERIERQPFIREEMRIPDVTDMDGLVSLMGRSMDNEESFHIDLLLASLSRMHPFVKQEDVERMVPVFEMARTVVEGGKDGVGELDVLAASFLLDYAQMLTGSERRVKSSKQQSFQDYKPYLDLVKLAFNRIKDYNTLPLLSTPTHRPAWIDRPCLSPGCLHIRKRESNRTVWTFKSHFRVWHWMIRKRLSG